MRAHHKSTMALCKKLTLEEAYARLQRMRRIPCEQDLARGGAQPRGDFGEPRDLAVGLGVADAGPGEFDVRLPRELGGAAPRDQAAKDGEFDVTLPSGVPASPASSAVKGGESSPSVKSSESSSAKPQPDVAAAVQSFRKILQDIEQQQQLERRQLEEVATSRSAAPSPQPREAPVRQPGRTAVNPGAPPVRLPGRTAVNPAAPPVRLPGMPPGFRPLRSPAQS
jgi:hypothetical protein